MPTVVIGGTGLLGCELKHLDSSLICVGSDHDVFEFTKLRDLLDSIVPTSIIHCAAIKSEKVDENPVKAININIIGTANLAKYCIEKSIRLVYISTDYVYPGIAGNYLESDPVLPHNKYAWTKLAGEAPVMLVPDHLIIRTSFGASEFPYKKAYHNLFVSKDYVDVIAPMVLKASLSGMQGVVNIGTDRKSLLDYASSRNKVDIASIPFQKDFSLNTDKFHSIT